MEDNRIYKDRSGLQYKDEFHFEHTVTRRPQRRRYEGPSLPTRVSATRQPEEYSFRVPPMPPQGAYRKIHRFIGAPDKSKSRAIFRIYICIYLCSGYERVAFARRAEKSA